ncbi:MAG: sulfite exporter TauE/SafE family protein [Pseudomonadota bacterium]
MAIAAPEFLLLVVTVIVAGLVRGFSGFGTAMVFLPVAGRVLDPFAAILILVVMDVFGPLPLVPRAVRDGVMKEIAWIVIAMAALTPVGVFLLTVADPNLFRWAVSLTVFGLLAVLISGFRHGLPFSPPTLLGTGAVAGVLGGVAGLPGPPVVMLYLSSDKPASVIRANTLIYLIFTDLAIMATLAAFGRFDLTAVWIGLALFIPYALAGLVGQRLFDPSRAVLYRRVAYTIVAIAALQGLPIWDGMLGA